MLLRNKGQVESRCPRGWKLAVAGGLTALAVIAAGVYVPPRSAKAAEPDKKQSSKPPAKEQLLDDVIEKLKKDVGDDPEKKKQLEELQKQVKPRPIEPPAQAPRSPRPFTVPPLPAPFLDPNLPEDELLKELLKGQEDLFKQLEQMLGQMQQGGQGFAFQLGPDGDLRPLRPRTGGGRLGVRVEKPSDVLASQLDLPAGRGLVCVDVPAQSTAGKVGIKPNDILLEVGGKPVPSDVSAFVAALKDIKPDQPVDIVVLRKGKKEAIKGVKLPEAKEVAAGPVGALPRLPNLQAAPLFPEVPAVPAPPGRGRSVPAPPGKGVGVVAGPGEAVRVEQVNDAFTVFYSKNGVKVTITGSKEDNSPPKAESIEVDDNGKTFKAESIDKLPKEYQDIARSAMKTIK